MPVRRTIIRLCAICALLVSAAAAQGASAANGTTAFTCKEGASTTPRFSDPDCTTTENGGKYTHFEIEQGLTTRIDGTSVGSTILKAKLAGANVTLTSPVAHIASEPQAWMTNVLDGTTKEHRIEGEGVITYTEVTTSLAGCGVTGLPGGAGMITTKTLKATTAGQGMGLKFAPKEGTVFAEFEFTGAGCSLKGTKIPVTGSVVGKAGNTTETMGGAITNFTHEDTTAQGTLFLGEGATATKAGIAGSLTFTNQDNNTPLSATTVT